MPNYGEPLPGPVELSQILRPGLDRTPDETGLATIEGAWSWRQLDALSTLYARNLLRLGLKIGDRVASLLPNGHALVIHYLATLKAGLVAVPLNYRYTAPELDHALEVSGAAALVYHAERRADIGASARARDLPLKIEAGEGAHGSTVESLFLPSEDPASFGQHAPSTPCFIFFTSGSTGPAKGVTHTFGNLGWMLANQAYAYQVSADDIVLPASSASHIGAFLMMLAGLSRGAAILLPRVGQMAETLDLMRRWRPTIFQMPPALLFQMERENQTTAADFDSVRLVLAGGDKVPGPLADEFATKTGLSITEIYGMTENGLSHINISSNRSKRGAVGRTAPGFTASIRDDDFHEVQPGTEGRLWVTFKGISPYYWRDEKATNEVRRDGWFDTGDVLRTDDQGYYWFCGRRKQLIVHDSSNIFPQEVEDALLAHDSVALAGVVGVRDLVHGENVRAYVTIKPGIDRPSAVELIAFARQRVGYKAPEEIVFLDTMPLTPSSKVDRMALKRLAEADHATALPESSP